MKQLLIALIVLSAISCLQITTTSRTLASKKKKVALRRKIVKKQVRKIVRKKKHVKSSKTWGSKTANVYNTKGATRGVGYGKSNVASFAGPQGVQTEAQGTRGTKNASSYATKGRSAHDNWGRTTGKFGNSNWASKGISNQDIKAAGQGQSKGKGASGSLIGEKGAKAHANGTKGASSGASWEGKGNNAQNSFGAVHAK